ncbi:glycosyltransferase family 2 protein [Halovulum sp. GXIMD14793]
MTDTPPVSVIVVSYRRPDHLRICLKAFEFQDYGNFELIVVSDKRPETPLPVRWQHFDLCNISAARNAGLVMARGQIVAFCDDDAVPEYRWLHHLVQPFSDPQIGFVGGFVRGRNGVSFQWRAQMIDPLAMDHQAVVQDAPWTRFDPDPKRVLNTVGTNFALRRDTAIALGGFDGAYHYFLDEADICMRLSKAGVSGAIVPLAQVHHGFAAGPYRSVHRVPRNLMQIGASTAHFLSQHCPAEMRATALQAARDRQRQRLHGFHHFGLLNGGKLRGLLQSFDKGAAEQRQAYTPVLGAEKTALDPVPVHPRQAFMLTCGMSSATARAEAAHLAGEGQAVTLLQVLPTHNNLTVSYQPEGYWLHQVGHLGRDAMRGPRRWNSTADWERLERARVASVRGLPPV